MTCIRRITIENIKGIEAKTLELDIIPNKPSLLVAPNGFGKSSLAVAFASLKANKIALHDDHHHKGDSSRTPKILVEYEDRSGDNHVLEANTTTNEISEHFDVFVINNQVRAKGTGKAFGGRTHVSASMTIEPVVLVDTVPEKVQFSYSYSEQKLLFGDNGKILPNIRTLFNDKPFAEKLSDLFTSLDRVLQSRPQGQIRQLKQDVNAQKGNATELSAWVTTNKLGELDSVEPLKIIADFILDTNTGITSRDKAYLAALQIAGLYAKDKGAFKKACKYNNYCLERERYSSVLAAFNTSWRVITPQEIGGRLIVEFPRAHHISNGQRDVLSFVALLHRAHRKLRKDSSILVIDEVFDYLDAANLVAVQYYITEFIDDYRSQGKHLYPLILTHLDPSCFETFVFSKQKCYFLDKRSDVANPSMVKLLQNRYDSVIEDDVSKYLLHYHPSQISRRADFKRLRLKETWGESDTFDQFVEQEVEKYRSNQGGYDPLAVCCAVRKRVEKLAYDGLTTQAQRTVFLDRHATKKKLEYAEEVGVVVPEYYYLLGIIYNDGMHWDNHQDNVSPIAARLENSIIAHMIRQLY